MGESKKHINSMYSCGVCSSYTEYRHFKKSPAKAAVADLKMSGISNAADGLVQAIADNFDTDISSQKGRQSTHSLAVLLTQYSQAPSEGEQEDNPRIRRVPNYSSEVPYDVDIHRYQGPKQPQMPESHAIKAIPTLKQLQLGERRRSITVSYRAFLQRRTAQSFMLQHETMQGAGLSSKTEDESHLLAPDRHEAIRSRYDVNSYG